MRNQRKTDIQEREQKKENVQKHMRISTKMETFL